jgi:hypothetical protein
MTNARDWAKQPLSRSPRRVLHRLTDLLTLRSMS